MGGTARLWRSSGLLCCKKHGVIFFWLFLYATYLPDCRTHSAARKVTALAMKPAQRSLGIGMDHIETVGGVRAAPFHTPY